MTKKNFIVQICFMCIGLIALILYSCDDSDGDPDLDQQAFDAADVVNGGRMYDKFWAEETNFTDLADPSLDIATITDYGDFYRCKGCHGWDQLGNSDTRSPLVKGIKLISVRGWIGALFGLKI